jgi:purine-binding chemotaxis protein CheW
MAEAGQYCTFKLNNAFFGLRVETVQEVLRVQEMTRVPLAPSAVRGLINLRGQIVPAIDLRNRLQMPPRDAELESINIVVRTEDGTVSFLVDEIGEVMTIARSAFEKPPETLRGAGRGLIEGAYKLENRLLLLLDAELLVKL